MITTLRAERLMLMARYDCYSFSPAIFLVVKELETEISWLEHGLWRLSGTTKERPYIGDALRYLRVTQEGQQWIRLRYFKKASESAHSIGQKAVD
jgi:hypothetical protein